MNRITHLVFLTATASVCACSQPRSLEIIDWDQQSGQPIPELITKTEQHIELETKFQSGPTIEYRKQLFGDLVLEDTWLKLERNSKNAKIIRAAGQLVAETPPRAKIKSWSNLAKHKELSLAKLNELEPALKSRQVERFELVLREDPKGVAPYWVMESSDLRGLMWRSTFDLELKLVMEEQLGSHFAVVPTEVFPKGPRLSHLQEVFLKNILPGAKLANQLARVESATGVQVEVQQSQSSLRFAPTDPRFDQVQAFFFVSQALDWFATQFGLATTAPLDIQVHVGAPEKTNTAFYYQGRIRLGEGDGRAYSRIALDPSVVTHETSHSLIDRVARLPFEGEGGSLNEAFADFFTASLLGNPKMGEASYLLGPFRRTIDVRKTFSEKKGALYADSVIISSLLWELRKTWGHEKTLQVAFATLRKLNPRSDFSSFQKSLIRSADELLNGQERLHLRTVLNDRAWPEESY